MKTIIPQAKRDTKGFTLIEMLVVIAILLVLAMLLLRSFDFAIRRSETVRCMNSMRQVAAALHAYRNDHDGWSPPGFPYASGGYAVTPPGMSPGSTRLMAHLIGYLTETRQGGSAADTFEMPFCPGGLNSLSTRITIGGTQWNDERGARLRASYAINTMMTFFKFDQFPPPSPNLFGNAGNNAQRNKELFDPSRYPFLLEVYSYGDHLSTWNAAHQNQALTGRWGFENDSANRVIRRTHSGNPNGAALNFLFMSGNIETVSRNIFDETSTNESWTVSASNPGGMFHSTGRVPANVPGRTAGELVYFPQNQPSYGQFKALYPQFSNYEAP